MSAASRPTVVYVVMLACSIFGLWVILTLGRNLKPPPNLSGQWQLTPLTPETANMGSTMQVEQSGRFLQIAFENGASFGMQMEGARTPSHIALRDNWMTIEFNGLDNPDAVQLVINPPHENRTDRWKIRRINQPAVALRGSH